MKEDFKEMINESDHQARQNRQHVTLPPIAVCGFCGKRIIISSFRDKVSLTEFAISNMCQECQDKTFKEGK